MAQVIDASVAVAWCVQSQATRVSEAARAAVIERGGHVPPQFWFEVLHSVLRSERRGFVSRTIVDQFVVALSEMPLMINATYDALEMINLYRIAREHPLTIYDAAYLELAQRLSLPLATRDAALVRAAQQAGVSLFTA